VRNTHKDKVPEEWIRKQTLVNAERYITEELKEYESKISSAEARIQILEQELYSQLVEDLQPNISSMQQLSNEIASIDCLSNFAYIAKAYNYHRPKLNDSFTLSIKEARHPVIEQRLPHDQNYIANDILLDDQKQQIMMITGPNMSGKSAILRQTALCVILAQSGSFIPAKEAEMGITDKLFTRVGASDNLSKGESTFMVEMNETAAIINNLSPRSLVLMDEIGRGTSTYDGISIAWAIATYLHESKDRPKTLFATHYHELNQMTDSYSRVKNYHVAVKESKDHVLFLRKLLPGGSEHSFGIHVAKMAGMPATLLQQAQKVLKNLEKSGDRQEKQANLTSNSGEMQLSFIQLDDPVLLEIKEELMGIDVNSLTPVEALVTLESIKKRLGKL
jgi:DNA mismatch repair protein MutS